MESALWHGADEAERDSDGRLTGLAVGVVTDNKDPEKLARVRVQLPWHAGSDTSFWARTAMLMAGGGRGTYFLPEVGDEVLVGAEDGDPSHLYVLGTLWNGKQTPPADNDDGKNDVRLITSRSGHTVRFNDDEAAPEVELRLADGKQLLLDKDGITLSDGEQNVFRITTATGAIEISAGQHLTLTAANVAIEATTAMKITSSGTLTLKGSMVQIN